MKVVHTDEIVGGVVKREYHSMTPAELWSAYLAQKEPASTTGQTHGAHGGGKILRLSK